MHRYMTKSVPILMTGLQRTQGFGKCGVQAKSQSGKRFLILIGLFRNGQVLLEGIHWVIIKEYR